MTKLDRQVWLLQDENRLVQNTHKKRIKRYVGEKVVVCGNVGRIVNGFATRSIGIEMCMSRGTEGFYARIL